MMPNARPPKTLADSPASKCFVSSTNRPPQLSPMVCTNKKRGHVAVYDFGGGTFDISILKLISTSEGDIYQVLSTNGDTHLGGDDIDNALMDVARREIQSQFSMELDRHGEAVQELRRALIRAKHELSSRENATVKCRISPTQTYSREFTRAEFEI